MLTRRRLSLLSLLGLTSVSGCVFWPPTLPDPLLPEQGGAAPDASAPRLPALETRHFERASSDLEVIGEVQVLFARFENTFSAIARAYNLGYEELRHANPGVDHWLPGEETPVYLPTRLVLPEAPKEGIVLNVASMRLFYFTGEDGALRVTTHPIGIGRQGWATPTGSATVIEKARDPIWYVPASVRAEHAELGDPLPSMVPPGPDNPLGSFAMAISMPGYLIHGTNKPAGVGMRVSHGCVRLYPEDIEALFERVPTGTPVHIVNQPALAGWRDEELYLEVHRPLAEDERDLAVEVDRVLAGALQRAGVSADLLDEEAVRRVTEERRGIPFPVLRSGRPAGEYLAHARIVENTVPVPSTEVAAQTDQWPVMEESVVR